MKFCYECGRRTVNYGYAMKFADCQGTCCSGCRLRVDQCTCLPVDSNAVICKEIEDAT